MKIGAKINIFVVSIVILSILVISMINYSTIQSTKNKMTDSFQTLGNNISEESSQALIEQTKQRLSDISQEKAKYIGNIFDNQRNTVQATADFMTRLYEHADEYDSRIAPLPDKSNDGTLVPQLLFSEKIAKHDDPKIQQEAGLIGNVADLLITVNQQNGMMSSNYVATTSGLMLMADKISAAKFDEQGNIAPYEADTRPWYQGAMATDAPFYTDVTMDIHGGGAAIMCGVPFYHGDVIMGVAGAGYYLTAIDESVVKTEVGETGFACIVNQRGEIIFSSKTEGELSPNTEERVDLRKSKNKELSNLVTKMVRGENGISEATIDGKKVYLAYSYMDAIDWTFVTVIEEDEVLHPSKVLEDMISMDTITTMKDADQSIRSAMIRTLMASAVIIFLAVIVSISVSGRISKPIAILTKEVQKIDGDNLEFACAVHTNDEIEVLAQSFRKMTNELKDYIRNLTRVTAEKERIGAELNVATQIQADMLPRIFPAFPDKNEFDIYATMDPAKEVGGDFYDFFIIDDDHLGFVIADVSGKGVPAALFMVIAKTLIRNHAQSGLPVEEVFNNVNDQLCEGNKAALFVTAWLAKLQISTGEVTYVNAGHNPPVLKKKNGAFQYISCEPGFILAGMEEMKYKSASMKLDEGDELFLYTDGVTEATDLQNQLYGEERLLQILNQRQDYGIAELLSNIEKDIDTFVGTADQFDDITMLIIRYLGV